MADDEGLRQRKPVTEPAADATEQETSAPEPTKDVRPTTVRSGSPLEILRIVLFGLYFFLSCLFIHGTQLLTWPLRLNDYDSWQNWVAMTKRHFGQLITTMTQLWSPTVVRISGDASMDGQLGKTIGNRLECLFPERLVLIANHQLYTDWLYLWWISYTARMHGHIYIILKQSLKWVPIIGTGMQFFGFIFVARKWVTDKARISYRLQKLRTEATDDNGKKYLPPMWLLIFPEGTNLSANTRKHSAAWSAKSGVPDLKNALLPRSTGLRLCLEELKGTVEYIYDCTIAYEGIPEGEYGQDIFTLRSVYFLGRPPKSVNMYWRRFKVSEIQVDDEEAVQKWVLDRWREKDALLEEFHKTGRFPGDAKALTIQKKDATPPAAPADASSADAATTEPAPAATATVEESTETHIETEVRTKGIHESFEMFVPVVTAYMVVKNLGRIFNFAQTRSWKK